MQGIQDGFVKLFCRPGTGIVLGGVVVAPRASELIFPIVARGRAVTDRRPARPHVHDLPVALGLASPRPHASCTCGTRPIGVTSPSLYLLIKVGSGGSPMTTRWNATGGMSAQH